MNQTVTVSNKKWIAVVVAIPLFGIVFQSLGGDDMFARSGSVLIVVALLLFSLKKSKAEKNLESRAKDTDEDRLKHL